MPSKCGGKDRAYHTRKATAQLSDDEVLRGLKSHNDPAWWELPHIKVDMAYLRFWGSCLRREARRRGLL